MCIKGSLPRERDKNKEYQIVTPLLSWEKGLGDEVY
jgi:hypothetical protein